MAVYATALPSQVQLPPLRQAVGTERSRTAADTSAMKCPFCLMGLIDESLLVHLFRRMAPLSRMHTRDCVSTQLNLHVSRILILQLVLFDSTPEQLHQQQRDPFQLNEAPLWFVRVARSL